MSETFTPQPIDSDPSFTDAAMLPPQDEQEQGESDAWQTSVIAREIVETIEDYGEDDPSSLGEFLSSVLESAASNPETRMQVFDAVTRQVIGEADRHAMATGVHALELTRNGSNDLLAATIDQTSMMENRLTGYSEAYRGRIGEQELARGGQAFLEFHTEGSNTLRGVAIANEEMNQQQTTWAETAANDRDSFAGAYQAASQLGVELKSVERALLDGKSGQEAGIDQYFDAEVLATFADSLKEAVAQATVEGVDPQEAVYAVLSGEQEISYDEALTDINNALEKIYEDTNMTPVKMQDELNYAVTASQGFSMLDRDILAEMEQPVEFRDFVGAYRDGSIQIGAAVEAFATVDRVRLEIYQRVANVAEAALAKQQALVAA